MHHPLHCCCDKQASPRMKHEFVSIMACSDWIFSMLSMYKSCWGRASRCFQCEYQPASSGLSGFDCHWFKNGFPIGTWVNFLDTSKTSITSLWVNKNEQKHDWNRVVPWVSTCFNLQYRYWIPCYSKSPSCDEMGDWSSVLMPLRLRVNVEETLSHHGSMYGIYANMTGVYWW